MMGMCANAQERSYDDWVALLAAADRRFQVRGVIRPPHAILSIIEVAWTGGESLPIPASGTAAVAEPLDKQTDCDADTGSHYFDFGSDGTAVGDDGPYALSKPTTDPKSVVGAQDAED